jgi:hypothetical protein
MKVDINAVNLRGKAKASLKKSGTPTKESIKKGMMGGFGAFSQGNDFGGTDWGNWGADWGQQSAPPPPSSDQWGGGNWQNDMNWDFGGGQQQGWGQDNWGDDGLSVQGKTSSSSTPSKSTPPKSTPSPEPESTPTPKPKRGGR